MTEKNNRIFSTKPINIIVGEVTNVIRAQGNPTATGLVIGTGIDSPIVNGQYYSVPQLQVGFMDYEDFKYAAGNFNDVESGIDNTVQHPWNSVGAVGLDALFVPYTTETNSVSAGPFLPHFTSPTGGAETPNASHLNPFNMFNSLADLQATGNDISNDVWMDSGHNISLALNYNPYDSGVDGTTGMVGISGLYPNGSGSPVDFYFEKDHFARKTVEKTAIRGVGFRGPMILSGPGYDVDGNPVPSSGGQPHPQANWNPSLWKTGPVDLRWDASRGVWTGGNTTKMFLVKTTNIYNPSNFSYEVDRSNSRSQYSRLAPDTKRTFSATENIYDPEYIAYTSNTDNVGTYESLDYTSVEFPHYEAFIIRETVDDVGGGEYYNLWTEDCQDCGHISNSGCGTQHGSSSVGKKILIENPLRQSLDVGDLAFTVKTGRRKKVNTGIFTGGDGSLGSGNIITDASGNASFDVTSSGDGYTFGAFGIVDSGICVSVSLFTDGGVIASGTVNPNSNLPKNQTYSVSIYPTNATAETETLDIHWIMQAEFKHQQVITHVEADGGLLQSCSVKIQTQGFKTCEWCGEDTSLINSF